MPLRIIFLFLSLISASQADSPLPELGHPSQTTLSPEQEKQLGDAFIRALKAQVSLVDDELVNDYIRNLGLKLASYSPEPGREFNFFIINANDINAFAGPNATIGINKGLILAAKNESQLASVMAHEIAHVTQKHLTRAYQAHENTNVTTLATVLAAILISAADPTAGAAVMFGGVAGGMQSQINFTRSNEYEADRVGIQIMTDSRFDPRGMIEFFEILQSRSLYGSENDLEYLRTHPLNNARIAEASNRAAKSSSNTRNDSLIYQLTRERLIVADSQTAASLIKNYAPHKNEKASKAYARALIYLRLNEPAKAITTLKALNKKHPHLWYQLSLAEAYVNNGDEKQATALYRQLNAIYPGYLPVTHAFARSLINYKKYAQSIQILEKQLSEYKNAETYNLLARAYSEQNNLLKAYSLKAEQYANDGFYELAVQQLTSALRLPEIDTETLKRLNAQLQIYKNKYKTE
ncbi:MAG: M48 family metalloprotease [Gammaproteobacteria bacterium]|nr:M48 family metalloprotease [Gammaproteobacteria bacterium]